jgi:dihydroorotate dehydrogenase (NAD+) catalytic subunit
MPTYNIHKSYEWNYQNGPIFNEEIPKREIPTKKIELLGLKLNSRIGIPAGPLLNSNWIKLYAKLGFDVLVYKTVRTITRECHSQPNCIFVQTEKQLQAKDAGKKIIGNFREPDNLQKITITNSFGMPSRTPKEWQTDIEKANSYLAEGQVMIVSIVGTPEANENIITDYVRCAALAKEAGAKIIEANYSCPNVNSKEGSIFLDSEFSAKISAAIKQEIGSVPLLIKIGNFPNADIMQKVVVANQKFVQGFAGINTIPMQVFNKKNEQALPGKGRLTSGLCGAGIRDIAQNFTKTLAELRQKLGSEFIICGVGGITSMQDFTKRLDAGADLAMSATGAMWNPFIAQNL